MELPKGKIIYVAGWYGNKNIGDELISIAVSKLLKKIFSECKVYISSYNPGYTGQILEDYKLQAVHSVLRLPLSINGLLKSISNVGLYSSMLHFFQSDIFMLGGGGFLSDWKGNKVSGWMRLVKLAKLLNKKTVIFFIGAGPFENIKTKTIIKRTFNDYTDVIIVRDKESKDYLLECGVYKEKINISIDPVFLLSQKNVINKTCRKNHISIGVNFIDYFRGDIERRMLYKKMLCESLNLLSELGKVRLIAMDQTDKKFMEENFSDYEIFYSDIPELFFKKLTKMDICIGVRFHFLVSSLINEIPTVPIIYNHKAYSICLNYKIEKYSLNLGDGTQWRDNIFTSKDLIFKTKSLIKNRDILKKQIHWNNKNMRDELEKSMQLIKESV